MYQRYWGMRRSSVEYGRAHDQSFERELQRADASDVESHRHPAQRHQRSINGGGENVPQAFSVSTSVSVAPAASAGPSSVSATPAHGAPDGPVQSKDDSGQADFLGQLK